MTEPLAPLLDIAAGRTPAASCAGIVPSAVEHRMNGLLLTWHQQHRIALAADEVTQLVAADLATAVRHQHIWSVLTGVVGALDGIGVACVTIKGVANETRWYSRLGERPCTDVDLVIGPGCIDRLDEVLAVLAPDYPNPGGATDLARRRQLQHVHFLRSGVTVDLHLDLLKLGMWVRQAGWWSAALTTAAAPDGTPVPVVAPELALLVALTHLNKDRFARLGSYAEVARIAGDPTLDWDRLGRFVAGEGLEVPVWASLAEVDARLQLGLDVPAARGWRLAAWRRLWPQRRCLAGDDGMATGRHRQMFLPVLARGRGRDAGRELRRRLLPPPALLALHDDRFDGGNYLRRVTVGRITGRIAATGDR